MPPPKCKIIIIGAGLAGLATAIALRRADHEVLVLEKMPHLVEIGAGINVPPNATRVFKELGILDALMPHAIEPEIGLCRSYRDGRVLSSNEVAADYKETFGSPYMVIHRVDLHNVLIQAAKDSGAEIRLNSGISKIQHDEGGRPFVELADGKKESADLVLCADGERSECRSAVLEKPIEFHDTGETAFRVTIPVSKLSEDKELLSMAEPANVCSFFGHRGHMVMYRVKKQDLLNVVLVNVRPPDTKPQLVPERMEISDVRSQFEGWAPMIHKALDHANGAMRWSLISSDPVPRWSNEKGTVGLIGDAAHAIPPYLGQGAGMGFEDAAFLGALFSKMQNKDQIPDILTMFEISRKSRTMEVRAKSVYYRDMYCLPDGPLQEERDRQLKEEQPFDGYPNWMIDPVLRPWLFGYDAAKDASLAWDRFMAGKFPGTRGTWKNVSSQ